MMCGAALCGLSRVFWPEVGARLGARSDNVVKTAFAMGYLLLVVSALLCGARAELGLTVDQKVGHLDPSAPKLP